MGDWSGQLDLRPIRERAEAATAGPWRVAPEYCGPDGQGVYQVESGGCVCEVGDPYPRGGNRPGESMRFIAHARADVPALLAEVERLRGLLAEAQAWLSGARSDEFPTRRTQRDLLCARIEAALPKDERV